MEEQRETVYVIEVDHAYYGTVYFAGIESGVYVYAIARNEAHAFQTANDAWEYSLMLGRDPEVLDTTVDEVDTTEGMISDG